MCCTAHDRWNILEARRLSCIEVKSREEDAFTTLERDAEIAFLLRYEGRATTPGNVRMAVAANSGRTYFYGTLNAARRNPKTLFDYDYLRLEGNVFRWQADRKLRLPSGEVVRGFFRQVRKCW
jgi:hypothetical protein